MLETISRVFKASIGVVALAAAVAVYVLLVRTRPQPARTDEIAAPPVVVAYRALRVPVPVVWSGYGTARPMDSADLTAEVQGTIVERPASIEAGVTVAAGDLIARIDPRDYEARLASAGARRDALLAQLATLEVEEARLTEQAELAREEVAVAERELERARTLSRQGAGNVSQEDQRVQALQAARRALTVILQQAESIPSRRAAVLSEVEAARADVRLAERNLEKTAIASPIPGRLQSVDVELGEFVREGLAVARVVDLATIEVPLQLPLSASRKVRVGDAATLTSDGPLGGEWVGEVSRIAPEADAGTRTVTIFVEVSQDPAEAGRGALLLPGQFVLGEVRSSAVEERLVLPRRAIDVETVLTAEPVAADASLPNAGAMLRPATLRESGVNVVRYFAGDIPGSGLDDREWAVVDDSGVLESRRVREGDLVVLTRLEGLSEGTLLDVRVAGSAETATATGGTAAPGGSATP